MNITLIFFVYGLAFFSLGLLMLFESGRSPLLADASALRPLAAFGLVHGAHEWLEMFLDKSDWLVIRHPVEVGWLRIVVLTISFISLLVFGLMMIQPMRLLQSEPTGARWNTQQRLMRWGVLAGYVALAILLGLFFKVEQVDRLIHLDASLRYTLAVPAALLSSLALMRQAAQGQRQGLPSLSRALGLTGFGFLLYGLTQWVVPVGIATFPGNWLNTASFLQAAGMPIQVVRAGCAILITVSLMRVVQVAEKERQRQFLAAQQERVVALEQVRQELLKREAMRQELIHSIVRAQEDERARIARELHDETSQTLTAFSLHLAALRALALPDQTGEKIALLQSLSRQMSSGLYRLVHDLRPAQLDDLGLASALSYLASENQKRLGLKVNFQVKGGRQRLAPFMETVIFRVAQEALTNAARHAKTDRADLTLEYLPDHIHLAIEDRGVGFTPGQGAAAKSIGLVGMSERAELIGGSLVVFSAPGQGTRVELVVPLERPEDVEKNQ